MKFKLEIQGGKYNGGHRYYKSWKGAKNAANKIVNSEKEETCVIDIYTIEDTGEKTFIGSILN